MWLFSFRGHDKRSEIIYLPYITNISFQMIKTILRLQNIELSKQIDTRDVDTIDHSYFDDECTNNEEKREKISLLEELIKTSCGMAAYQINVPQLLITNYTDLAQYSVVSILNNVYFYQTNSPEMDRFAINTIKNLL